MRRCRGGRRRRNTHARTRALGAREPQIVCSLPGPGRKILSNALARELIHNVGGHDGGCRRGVCRAGARAESPRDRSHARLSRAPLAVFWRIRARRLIDLHSPSEIVKQITSIPIERRSRGRGTPRRLRNETGRPFGLLATYRTRARPSSARCAVMTCDGRASLARRRGALDIGSVVSPGKITGASTDGRRPLTVDTQLRTATCMSSELLRTRSAHETSSQRSPQMRRTLASRLFATARI